MNLDDQALQFVPASVTIAAGGTVNWVWGGSQFHDVTGEGFASDTKNSGSFAHTFATPGTYAVLCTIHESRGMRATIIVK